MKPTMAPVLQLNIYLMVVSIIEQQKFKLLLLLLHDVYLNKYFNNQVCLFMFLYMRPSHFSFIVLLAPEIGEWQLAYSSS